jgi:hypothetical protein
VQGLHARVLVLTQDLLVMPERRPQPTPTHEPPLLVCMHERAEIPMFVQW